MSLCFGSAQLMAHQTWPDWCLESHPKPFLSPSPLQSGRTATGHLTKQTGATTEPFILLCWRVHELDSLPEAALLPRTWSLQDLYHQLLKGLLHSILCLGTGLWRKKLFYLIYSEYIPLSKNLFGDQREDERIFNE